MAKATKGHRLITDRLDKAISTSFALSAFVVRLRDHESQQSKRRQLLVKTLFRQLATLRQDKRRQRRGLGHSQHSKVNTTTSHHACNLSCHSPVHSSSNQASNQSVHPPISCVIASQTESTAPIRLPSLALALDHLLGLSLLFLLLHTSALTSSNLAATCQKDHRHFFSGTIDFLPVPSFFPPQSLLCSCLGSYLPTSALADATSGPAPPRHHTKRPLLTQYHHHETLTTTCKPPVFL